MRTVVLKIGTGLLTCGKSNISARIIDRLSGEIAELNKNGFRTAVVSSGAVGCGMIKLGVKKTRDIAHAQMLASVGQPILMDIWMKALKKRGLTVAQILCSADDFSDRKKYLNLRRTIIRILDAGIVPVINENDSVTIDELKFGDNDRLSALVASHIEASDLVILTNVKGFYDGKKLVRKLKKIDCSVLDKADGASLFGTGGMRSKLLAGKITRLSGCRMTIASGKKAGILKKILIDGTAVGTQIDAARKLRNKKRWIVFASLCSSSISVDGGAYEAIVKRGKSLLSAGISGIKGSFLKGAAVILSHKGQEFARGLVNYSSVEIEKIRGHRSSEIKKILGYSKSSEVISRDNLVLVEE